MMYYQIGTSGLYVLAKEIEAEAIKHGYQPRRDRKTNRTHPGRECNETIRQIKRTRGLQNKYRLRDEDVLSILPEVSQQNEQFIEMLKQDGIIHHSTVNNEEGLQLYSKKAAEAILGVWLNDTDAYLVAEDTEIWSGVYYLTSAPKNLAKKKDRKTTKLF